jgi:hypothetical protein
MLPGFTSAEAYIRRSNSYYHHYPGNSFSNALDNNQVSLSVIVKYEPDCLPCRIDGQRLCRDENYQFYFEPCRWEPHCTQCHFVREFGCVRECQGEDRKWYIETCSSMASSVFKGCWPCSDTGSGCQRWCSYADCSAGYEYCNPQECSP